MSFQLGQIIGDYEFVDVLHSSKTNVAYKVKNVLAQRFETLKIVPGDLHHDPERLERFQREIKIHARLDHPNILAFYNASVLNGHLVMTTAYVEGATLEERLELGPLPWRQAVEFAAQVASALGHAHTQGIVHREITPGNIVVADNRAILAGFGQAKAAHDPRLTQKGAVVGALHYMSPEQVKGADQVDHRSDVYSLGAVLFEMVTGQRMFTGKSHFDIMVAHVNQAPPNPTSLAPDLPAEAAQVILKAVAKEPSQRYADANAMRAALVALGTGEAPVENDPQTLRPLPSVERRRSSSSISQAHTSVSSAVIPPPLAPVAPMASKVVDVKLPPAAVGAASSSNGGAIPASVQKNSADVSSEFNNSDRKAIVVLVCTLFFLLISTMVMTRLN